MRSAGIGASAGVPLELALACMGDPACPIPATVPWLEDWDDVRVECRVASRRPDIVLFRGGREVGAVEFVVSHAVDREKAVALRASGMPWVEVRAADVWGGSPERSWAGTTPLPVTRARPSPASRNSATTGGTDSSADVPADYADVLETITLAARGRALREMEAETRAILDEVDALRARAEAEEADIRTTQVRAAAAANGRRRELALYWRIGGAIVARQAAVGWGKSTCSTASPRTSSARFPASRGSRRALSAEFAPPGRPRGRDGVFVSNPSGGADSTQNPVRSAFWSSTPTASAGPPAC